MTIKTWLSSLLRPVGLYEPLRRLKMHWDLARKGRRLRLKEERRRRMHESAQRAREERRRLARTGAPGDVRTMQPAAGFFTPPVVDERLERKIRERELDARRVDRQLTLGSHVPDGHPDPEGEFRRLGAVLARRIIEAIPLIENAGVIDVGCGGGRVAAGLMDAAPGPIRYLGFDIRPRDIAFARDYLTSHNRNYQFIHLDFYNQRYNPKGRIRLLEDYYFPAPSESFDVAVATSFFTHVDRAMAERCLSEIARVLKPGGKGYLTFFIMGQGELKRDRTRRQFVLEFEPGVWTGNPQVVYQSVAFRSDLLLGIIEGAGLVVERTLPGIWRGRAVADEVFEQEFIVSWATPKGERQSQDVIVVSRK